MNASKPEPSPARTRPRFTREEDDRERETQATTSAATVSTRVGSDLIADHLGHRPVLRVGRAEVAVEEAADVVAGTAQTSGWSKPNSWFTGASSAEV